MLLAVIAVMPGNNSQGGADRRGNHRFLCDCSGEITAKNSQ
jgi:hypothetical protein